MATFARIQNGIVAEIVRLKPGASYPVTIGAGGGGGGAQPRVGVTLIRSKLWGAGGGGGGGGGGAAGGGYSEKLIPVTPGQVITVTIGNGGGGSGIKEWR